MSQIRLFSEMADRLLRMDTSAGACPCDPQQSNGLDEEETTYRENDDVMYELLCLMEYFKSSCSVIYDDRYLPVPSPRVYDRRLTAALRLLRIVFACYSRHARIILETRSKLLTCIAEFLCHPDAWSIIENVLVQGSGGQRTHPYPFFIPDQALLKALQQVHQIITNGSGTIKWETINAHFSMSNGLLSDYYPAISECSRLLDWIESRMPSHEAGMVPLPILGNLVLLSDDLGYGDLLDLVERGEEAGRMIADGKAAVVFVDSIDQVIAGLSAVRFN